MAESSKSIKVAYFLLAFLGLQGAHQFYLGNWKRGLAIAGLIHLPTFWFAHLDGVSKATGEPLPLGPALIIFFALLTGIGLFLQDLFTLHKRFKRVTPPQINDI